MSRILCAVLAVLLASAVACTTRPKTKEEFLDEGAKQLQAQNPASAIIYFKSALEKDQNYLDARLQLARAYFAVGKYDAASKELQKIVLQRPGAEQVKIELARAYALSGRPDEALGVIDQIAGKAGSTPDLLEASGWANALKGNYKIAVEQLEKCLLKQSGRTSTLSMLARVYLLMGNPSAARSRISELLAKQPSDRNALYLLADIQASEKDVNGALATYDQLVKKQPNESAAYFRKGLLLISLGRYEEAYELSEVLIKNFSARPEGYKLKGIDLFYKKNYKEAIAFLQRTVTRETNGGAYYFLGLCHFSLGEFEQAMNQFQRALALNPNLTQARLISSLLYLRKNNTDEAVSEIKKVLAVQDRNALAHSILGSAYLSKGLYRDGLGELNRALELDPKLIDARLRKGMFEISRGKTGEGETDLKTAVLINPELLNARLLLASLYLQQNQNEKAAAIAQRGLGKGKTDALLHNVVAEACLREGRLEDAMAALEAAKQADPDYDATYFKIALLYQLFGKQEKGLAILREFAEGAPLNVRAQLIAASMLETGGNEKEARQFYERALKTGRAEGIVETARYYLRTHEHDAAIRILDDGLRKNPSSPEAWLLKGQACQAQKKFDDALLAYEEAAKTEPESGLAALINAYLEMNKPERAIDRVLREMRKSPGRLDHQAELSRIYVKTGKWREAAENARHLIQNQPDSAQGYMTLAMVHQSAGEHEKAIIVLREAMRLHDVKLTIMLGNLYATAKKYGKALEQSRRAESLRPGYVPAIFQKASLLQLMGKKKEAIAEYQRVLKLSHNHVPALNNIAYLYAEDQASLSRAFQYAVQAYMLAPRDASVQDTVGFVLLKNGKIDQGLKAFKQALLTADNNPSIYYHMALALKEQRKTSEAVSYLQKALGLGDFPEYAEAKMFLMKLHRMEARRREN